MNSVRRSLRWAAVLIVCSSVLGFPRLATAQLTAGQSVAGFEFSLSNPGARSLGLGGAFAGVADDATAAYANPAALVILARPEVSCEVRQGAAAVEFSSWGTTKIAGPGDSVAGVRFEWASRKSDSSLGGTSFVSVSYGQGTWAAALYAHQLAELDASIGFARAEVPSRQLDTRSSVSIDIGGIGLSGAYRLSKKVSLGGTLVMYSGRAQVLEEEVISGSDILRQARSVNIDDSDVAINLGVLVVPNTKTSLGGYYRKGPSLGARKEEVSRGRVPEVETAEPLHLPDVFGIGAGHRPNDRLLLAFEWSRVLYSKLDRREDFPADFPEDQIRIDDKDELRLGLEYSFWDIPIAPAIRIGVWWDPEHALRSQGRPVPCPGELIEADDFVECRSSEPLEDPRDVEGLAAAVLSHGLGQLFPGAEDEIHYSAGVGVVIGRRLQIDGAIDFVDNTDYALSFSGVLRF